VGGEGDVLTNKREELEHDIKSVFTDERVAYYRYQVYEENGLKVTAFV